MWNETWVEIRILVTSAGGPKRRDWVETVSTSKAGDGKADTAKIERKVATTEDQLGKEIVASRLCDSLLAATINRGMIAKLEED